MMDFWSGHILASRWAIIIMLITLTTPKTPWKLHSYHHERKVILGFMMITKNDTSLFLGFVTSI